MTTFSELTTRIIQQLHSSTGLHEQMTWLTAPCTASDLTLTVNNSTAIYRGISEIEDELVYAASTDTGTITLAPFGRGYRGSTAATHATNSAVIYNPTFPRVEVKKAINQALQAVYPALYQLKTTTFTFGGAQLTYELPADCELVHKVIWEMPDATGYWETSYGWRFEQDSEESTGKAITLLDQPRQGQTVKVVYQAKFSALSANADTLEDTGLPASAEDVLEYFVASKLIRFMDVSRLQLDNVENMSRAQVVGPGDAGKIANQMFAMYQQRLAEERARLLRIHPPQLYFTR